MTLFYAIVIGLIIIAVFFMGVAIGLVSGPLGFVIGYGLGRRKGAPKKTAPSIKVPVVVPANVQSVQESTAAPPLFDADPTQSPVATVSIVGTPSTSDPTPAAVHERPKRSSKKRVTP